MKRDMKLIRTILELLEKHGGINHSVTIGPGMSNLKDMGEKINQVQYHMTLLIEGGFVIPDKGKDTCIYDLQRLTWRGHDLLDTIRNQDSDEKIGEFGDSDLW